MTSPGCSSVSVKWQQFSASAPAPVQAPQQIHALFNDCHTLVYGFVPHCTQVRRTRTKEHKRYNNEGKQLSLGWCFPRRRRSLGT